jgi:hypothetical protein
MTKHMIAVLKCHGRKPLECKGVLQGAKLGSMELSLIYGESKLLGASTNVDQSAENSVGLHVVI